MKTVLNDPSLSLRDFQILPAYTEQRHKAENVLLRTPLCRRGDGFIYINLPFLSAAMHAVTGIEMATASSTLRGVGVLPLIASIEEHCPMVRAVKWKKDMTCTGGSSTILPSSSSAEM